MKHPYLLICLFVLSISSNEAFAIKIVIKSSSEKSQSVTPFYSFNFFPVLINGLDYDFFGGQDLPLASFSQQSIIFEFDDEMGYFKLPEDVNDRFFKLIERGWKNIFEYNESDLQRRGMLTTKIPPSSVVLIFVATGEIVDSSQVASFTKDAILINHISELVYSSLKAGQLIILKNTDTGHLVETLIFLANDYFIGWDGSKGGFYIQNKEQIETKMKKAEVLMHANKTQMPAYIHKTLQSELTPLSTNALPSYIK